MEVLNESACRMFADVVLKVTKLAGNTVIVLAMFSKSKLSRIDILSDSSMLCSRFDSCQM